MFGRIAIAAAGVVVGATGLRAQARTAPDCIADLRIDPLLVATVREYRNVNRTIGSGIWPGWRANTVPILLYRPGVQDVLIGAPRVPAGFRRYCGRPLLAGETIYVRNDTTVMALDDQNTSIDLDSMRVLVVADQYSRLRNQLRDMLGRPAEFQNRWLGAWNFISSPYDDLRTMLHESFHVHQNRLAPDKGADESAVATYPVLDPANNALTALEGMILRDAILATDPGIRRAKVAQFLAVRAARRAGLDSAAIGYEDLNEFAEGLARYVELRFLQLAPRVTPTAEMYLRAGFTGYRGAADRALRRSLDDMVQVAGNSDDRFGNRYGGGPLRFRLYYLGSAQGLLLDDLAPDWKGRIFGDGVYLTDLLERALALSAADREAAFAQARADYGYQQILAEKEAFAAEGRRLIQARVDSIVGTRRTLVTIRYGAAGERMGISYTPFGVTAINNRSAIYDLVPIAIRFANRVLLRMKAVVPTIVDRSAHTITFAIGTPAGGIVAAADGSIDVGEFSLSASANTTVAVDGNRVTIELR